MCNNFAINCIYSYKKKSIFHRFPKLFCIFALSIALWSRYGFFCPKKPSKISAAII